MLKNILKYTTICTMFIFGISKNMYAQLLELPSSSVNYPSLIGRTVGLTDIEIKWNAPGVKGRQGNIWGTPLAHYGYTVLGYGSNVASPWRAGADECTTISFSTDVTINGKNLAAGKYAFFIAIYPDSCEIIFNKNTSAWGSYFYDNKQDVLKIVTRQQKDMKTLQERLNFSFANQTEKSVEVALEWEYWRIPFTVDTDIKKLTLASIRSQLSGEMGFDPPSLQAGASWCLRNQVNEEEALNWINSAIDPNLGGIQTFNSLSVKAGLLRKLNRIAEADKSMAEAVEKATVIEMHGYGRQLIYDKKPKEALEVFEKNYIKYKGAWPTQAGLMRGYSANGDYKKALEHAKLALSQAPDDVNKKALELAIKTLSEGKPL